jgi:hypothetical protein
MIPQKTKPKCERRQRGSFAPGHSGNPAGRPAGSRNRATILMDLLAEGQGEEILRKNKRGDATARKLVLDRIWPVRKGRPVSLAIPPIDAAEDLVKALGFLASAVGSGELTPDESAALATVFETKRKAIETVDLAKRIETLEAERKK